MSGDYSRREFVSLLGSATASALAACGGGRSRSPTEPQEPPPDQQTGPATYVVKKQGDTVEARVQSSDEVVASGTNARRVIQAALDEVQPGGVVHIREGTYVTDTERLRIMTDEVEVKGDGVGNTILKMDAGINEDAGPILGLQEETTQSTLREIEINGNESENRNIPPYPDSPPGHGLIVNGERNTVEDVYVHDTIRSNIVLNGKQCELTDLELENAATDHWLYITDGDDCSVTDVHASGFARGSGITIGVGERTCHGNVVENVTIEDAIPHPSLNSDATDSVTIAAHYPYMAIIWRGAENARNNTVRNVEIRGPHPTYGHILKLRHQGATLRGLSYKGPIGFWPAFLTIGGPDNPPHATGDAPGGELVDATIEVTKAVDKGAGRPVVVESGSSEVRCENVQIQNAVGASLRGVALEGEFRPVDDNSLRQVSIESSGPAIVGDGREHPVRNLSLNDITDVGCSGIETKGEVTFTEKDVTCP